MIREDRSPDQALEIWRGISAPCARS